MLTRLFKEAHLWISSALRLLHSDIAELWPAWGDPTAWPCKSRQCPFVIPGPMLDFMFCHYPLEILYHFLNRGPHLFILHWVHQLCSQSCSWAHLLCLGHHLSHRPATCHLCECCLTPLWALCQDSAGIRLKYTFIRNSSFRKQEGPQWLLGALQLHTAFVFCKACKMKMGISNKIQKYVCSLCFPVVADSGRQCSFFNRLLIKEENETDVVFR